MTGPTFPLDELLPLARYTPSELHELGQPHHDHVVELRPSENKLARRLGVSGGTWRRYKNQGLTVDQADRLATRLGFHPSNVWPTWPHGTTSATNTVKPPQDRPAVAPPRLLEQRTCGHCDTSYAPRRADQRWCSTRCRDAAHNARQHAVA